MDYLSEWGQRCECDLYLALLLDYRTGLLEVICHLTEENVRQSERALEELEARGPFGPGMPSSPVALTFEAGKVIPHLVDQARKLGLLMDDICDLFHDSDGGSGIGAEMDARQFLR